MIGRTWYSLRSSTRFPLLIRSHGWEARSTRSFSGCRTSSLLFPSLSLTSASTSYLCTTRVPSSQQCKRYFHNPITPEAEKRKSRKTPLAEYMISNMKLRGPLTISSFMREALTNPRFGYYMKTEGVIGRGGDFITSPEISQMFGELLGIFCVHSWQALGRPKKVHLVELGPGKGTLMKDLLRTTSQFPEFHRATEVHLVEVSPTLRKLQAIALDCKDFSLTETSPPSSTSRSISSTSSSASSSPFSLPLTSSSSPIATSRTITRTEQPATIAVSSTTNHPLPLSSNIALPVENPLDLEEKPFRAKGYKGTTVNWHSRLESIKFDAPVLIIAQEFFDALPVHQIEFTANGWRERLVDIDEEGPHYFRPVIAPSSTLGAQVLIQSGPPLPKKPEPGDVWEISPESLSVANRIGKVLEEQKGCALIIDYGQDRMQSNTLRGIKEHAFCDPFEEPGNVDLSADVDFSALRYAAKKEHSQVDSLGPITQGDFLINMGIEVRLANLLKGVQNETIAEELINGFKRLVDPDQMGSIYKVLCLKHSSLNQLAGFDTLRRSSSSSSSSSPTEEMK